MATLMSLHCTCSLPAEPVAANALLSNVAFKPRGASSSGHPGKAKSLLRTDDTCGAA